MMRSGVGLPPRLREGQGGFRDVGEARLSFMCMVKGLTRIKEISEHVEHDQLNIEKHVKELADVTPEMFKAGGAMAEQEH